MTKLPLPLFSLTVPSRTHMGTQPWPRLCTAENMEAMPCLCHEPLVTTIHLQIAECTTVRDGTRRPHLIHHITKWWITANYSAAVECITMGWSYLLKTHSIFDFLSQAWIVSIADKVMDGAKTDQSVCPGKTYILPGTYWLVSLDYASVIHIYMYLHHTEVFLFWQQITD